MDKSEVYHDLRPLFGLDKMLSPDNLRKVEFQRLGLGPPFTGGKLGDRFKLVARVDSSSLEEIFRLTNHIDQPWFDNEGVEPVNGTEYRSTSVGDLVHLRTGKWYICEPVGWKEIEINEDAS